MRGGKSSFLFLLWPWTTSAEWSEGPSAAAGGAGSKRRRTGDRDDADDGEDDAVSAQLGARLSMNENIRRAKKLRAQSKRLGEIRG